MTPLKRYALPCAALFLAALSLMISFGNRGISDDWWWQAGQREIHANFRAVWWYTHDNTGGFWDTTLMYWPPRIQEQYMSKAMRENVMAKDWQTDERRAEFLALHRIDDQKFWTWPDYYGLNDFWHDGRMWGHDTK